MAPSSCLRALAPRASVAPPRAPPLPLSSWPRLLSSPASSVADLPPLDASPPDMARLLPPWGDVARPLLLAIVVQLPPPGPSDASSLCSDALSTLRTAQTLSVTLHAACRDSLELLLRSPSSSWSLGKTQQQTSDDVSPLQQVPTRCLTKCHRRPRKMSLHSCIVAFWSACRPISLCNYQMASLPKSACTWIDLSFPEQGTVA